MLTKVPRYIEESQVMKEPIAYEWNDKRPRQACRGDDPKFLREVARISRRGKLAFCTAIAEWIVWRLSPLSTDKVLFQVVEAMWAAVVDVRYAHPLDSPGRALEWQSWSGPIRGPLCTVFHILARALDCASRNEATEVDAVSLSNLALYVIKDSASFKKWRRISAERMGQLHPRTSEDPNGIPVPREALDPDFSYRPEMASELVVEFLAKLDFKTNPYLQTPQEMKQAGFEGTPYQV